MRKKMWHILLLAFTLYVIGTFFILCSFIYKYVLSWRHKIADEKNMRKKMWHILLLAFTLYVIGTFFILCSFIYTTPGVREKHRAASQDLRFEVKNQLLSGALSPKKAEGNKSHTALKERVHIIEVWSKVGLGSYTWEHLFGGQLEPRLGGIWSYGEIKIENLLFRMRDGDGVLPDRVPQDVENLILILNGRSQERVQDTQAWLDYLDAYPHLSRVILMLIGSEQCQNDWTLPYMKDRGGRIDVMFVVYDSLLVNGNNILQWPLGAATYRGFPPIQSSQLNLLAPRRYRCNFLGTVYPNSSREQLLEIINNHGLQNYCFLKPRNEWQAEETDTSLQTYISILLDSDLTLSPAGMNVECYRIYEACALGSVPVIEDVTTEGDCSKDSLRLLKEMNAPFIFIKDWKELPWILEEEIKMTVDEIVERRLQLIAWYEKFKDRMKGILLTKVNELFEKDIHR